MKTFLIGLLAMLVAAPAMAQVEKRKVSFRSALIAAAEEAQKKGDITRGELILIRGQTLLPGRLKKIQTFVAEEAISRGIKPPCADPYGDSVGWDWNSLLDFLREFLPMIMEFIKQLMDWFSLNLPNVEGFAYQETVVPIVGQCAGGVCPLPQQVVVTPGAGEAGPVMVEPQQSVLQFHSGQPVRNIGRAIVRPLRWLRPRNWFRGRCG